MLLLREVREITDTPWQQQFPTVSSIVTCGDLCYIRFKLSHKLKARFFFTWSCVQWRASKCHSPFQILLFTILWHWQYLTCSYFQIHLYGKRTKYISVKFIFQLIQGQLAVQHKSNVHIYQSETKCYRAHDSAPVKFFFWVIFLYFLTKISVTIK